MSILFCRDCKISEAVLPKWFFILMSALCCNNFLMALLCPTAAANIAGVIPVRGVVALGSKERSSKYLKMCACPNKMAKATGEKVFCKLRLDMPPQRRWFRIWSTISRWPHVTLIKNTFIPEMGALDFLTSFVGGLTKFVLLGGVSPMLQQ
jgi:hypothetical protein